MNEPIKYFTCEEQGYDETFTTIWRVNGADTEVFLALVREGLFGGVVDVSTSKRDQYAIARDFTQYLKDTNKQIAGYLNKKKKRRVWESLVAKEGAFYGGSLGMMLPSTGDNPFGLKPGEKERWDATRGLQYLSTTEELIRKLKDAEVLDEVLTR